MVGAVLEEESDIEEDAEGIDTSESVPTEPTATSESVPTEPIATSAPTKAPAKKKRKKDASEAAVNKKKKTKEEVSSKFRIHRPKCSALMFP